ncbi:glucose 1-dehydrogenase [Pseudomaricurvus alkylphenolicus]|uniref:glucose 1-dehydrogenase n=1 Tax=Pseudomaricurvus alkylphenolicus TaxID=1306991 RepID=UPI001421545C|nr:glucose 1-dehydrogenase [Pseudomaricurvus alkylphenolicus]NIB41609.1 glucose 1-dehydrogenase [Pseudomaricurvus alkylphenolicus]
MRLTNKVVFVSGAASGIGRAICERLADEGARVAVADINADAAESLAFELRAGGHSAIAIEQDVTDEQRWVTALEQCAEQLGSLNVLINNAGIALIGNVEDASLADWQTTHRVNNDAVFLGTREAIKLMSQSGGGSIINVSSIEGIIGEPLLPAYNASKGAVRVFTKSAALHCASRGYNIRVNSLHPGYISTPMVSSAMDSLNAAEAHAFQQRIVQNIPLGALGEPVDIANAALFLASDESRYMTGAELIIDGGYTAR